MYLDDAVLVAAAGFFFIHGVCARELWNEFHIDKGVIGFLQAAGGSLVAGAAMAGWVFMGIALPVVLIAAGIDAL